MLAQKLDPVDPYRFRANAGAKSPLYRRKLHTRGISIHARFVERALDLFAGSSIVESIPSATNSFLIDSKRGDYDVKA